MGVFNLKRSIGIGGSNMINSHPETNGTIPARTLALLSLTAISTALTLSSLLAQCGDAALFSSWIACMLSASVMFLTSKKISHAIFKVLGLALALSFFSYPVIPAIIFGGIISIGAFSTLICSAKKSTVFLIALLPVASYAISFAITTDSIISLAALVLYLPAALIGVTSRHKAALSTSVISGAAVLFAIIVGGFVLMLNSFYGEISRGAIDSLINDFTDLTLSYTKESFALIEGLEFSPAMEKAMIAAIDTYVNIAIGLVIALCTCVSYAAVKIKNAIFATYGADEYLTAESTKITVSIPAAALFSISFIMTFALDSANRSSLVAIVATNICIILAPGLAVMGICAIKAAPTRFGVKGALLSAALTAAIVITFIASPMILPLVGAIYIILRAIDLWAKDFYGKGENQ